MINWHYIKYLRNLGFSQKQAERIEEGTRIEALPEDELLQFAAAWKNDRVEPMRPLVEKYGWEELAERLEKSIEQ